VAITPELLSEHAGLIGVVDGIGVVRPLLDELEQGTADEPSAVSLPESLQLPEASNGALVGCLANLRPFAAALARSLGDCDTITLVCASNAGHVCSADVWVAGTVIRTLFEELGSPTELTDAGGVAITVAMSYPDAANAMLGSMRGRHLGADALQRATATNVSAVVPMIASDDSGLRLTYAGISAAAL
jgi:hypothetical protein